MTAFKVINRFKDNQQDGHVYEIGDAYPADGKKLDEKRAEFLTKKHAKYGVVFLEKVEDKEPEEVAPKAEPKKKATTKKKSDA